MPIQTEFITIPVQGATDMQVFVARPELSNAPCVLVFQEAFGVNAHIRDVAKRFAEQGYLAMAPEFFHRTAAPGFEVEYGDYDSVRKHMANLTTDDLKADVRAAYDLISADKQAMKDSVGSVGYCMGGRVSYIANSFLPLRAAISYYGGGIAPALLPMAAEQQAPILFFWGGLDKHITPDVRDAVVHAMRESGKDFINVEFAKADHAFFCDARQNYNPDAANESWALTLSFFDRHLR